MLTRNSPCRSSSDDRSPAQLHREHDVHQLKFNRTDGCLSEQRSRAIAQNLRQSIGKGSLVEPFGKRQRRYHPFDGVVGASNTPTIRRLTPSCRHQLSRIARVTHDE
jgi:hypothetical protein